MDLNTALRTRGSTRALLRQPVERSTVEAMLERARFAPSGSNIQPWHVHVVTATVRDSIRHAVRPAPFHEPDRPAAPCQYYPAASREPAVARRRACRWGLYSLLGIAKGDRAAALTQVLRDCESFDAPVGLFFCIDADLGPARWRDYGMFREAVTLAAVVPGLAACPAAAWARVHRLISAPLSGPGSQTLIRGMALGAADPAAPVNRFRPERLVVGDCTRGHGCEAGA